MMLIEYERGRRERVVSHTFVEQQLKPLMQAVLETSGLIRFYYDAESPPATSAGHIMCFQEGNMKRELVRIMDPAISDKMYRWLKNNISWVFLPVLDVRGERCVYYLRVSEHGRPVAPELRRRKIRDFMCQHGFTPLEVI